MNQAQEITSLLQSASSTIHTEILLVLRREEIEKHCKTLLETKGFNKPELAVELAAIITKYADTDSEQIIEFLKECTEGGFYTLSMLLSEKKFNLLTSEVVSQSKYSNILQNIVPSLVKWSGKSAGKTDDGQGERALILLTKNAKRPLEQNGSGGDISFDNHGLTIEVKGTDSRLTNSSNPTVETLKSGVKDFLTKQGENPIDKDFHANAKFSYHINNKGITKLNRDVLKKSWCIKEYVTHIMTVAFPKIEPCVIEKRIKNITKNNQIDWQDFIDVWMFIEFEHYHHTSNHSGISFVNPNTLDYKHVSNGDVLVKSVNDGEIVLKSTLNLHSGREATMQYTLR
jgi:hypothetical protein